ncbi:MAG: DUF1761 domain-containing protein [Ignavibacteria bacterium]|nr:DUF1761 domain-containing protein [Ignavibacteria bacterium]
MELHGEINYIAVLLCGIVAMGIGALWYSPMLFGKIWVASIDKTEEELEKDFQPIKAYSVSFLAQLVMAFVLALLLRYVNAGTPEEGIRLGFMVWIGFTATTMTVNFLFEGKTFKHFLVDSSYHFIVLMLSGLILGAWSG